MLIQASEACDLQESWKAISQQLLHEFGEPIYKSWLLHIKPTELKDGVLTVTVPSNFISEWIKTNYFNDITNIVSSINPLIKQLDIQVRATTNLSTASANDLPVAPEKIDFDNKPTCEITSSLLDPKFIFNNFVVGNANKVAFSAAKAIAEESNAIIANNILYIQAPVGMGKTHLIQAIASHIKQNSPNKKIAYLSAEKFMHLYVKAIKNNELVDFKEKLRSVELFLLDDLQFICGKTSTQQEFINTFNALTEANKKVVLSSDHSPYALNLDQRSISRLAGGLVVEIKPSDYDLRKQILYSKSTLYNVPVPDKVIELLAEKITSSNRELEGSLNKLITYCTLEETEITLEAANNILKDNIEAHINDITVEEIIERVAKFYNIKISDITSKSRAAKFAKPRQVAAYLAKKLTTKSLQDIGFKLGNRNHATILYSVRKLEESLKTDLKLASEIQNIPLK